MCNESLIGQFSVKLTEKFCFEGHFYFMYFHVALSTDEHRLVQNVPWQEKMLVRLLTPLLVFFQLKSVLIQLGPYIKLVEGIRLGPQSIFYFKFIYFLK